MNNVYCVSIYILCLFNISICKDEKHVNKPIQIKQINKKLISEIAGGPFHKLFFATKNFSKVGRRAQTFWRRMQTSFIESTPVRQKNSIAS